MLIKEIVIESSICSLCCVIGVFVNVICAYHYLYYIDTYRLEHFIFDKIFIPVVYAMVGNIVLSFLTSSIYELYINLKYFKNDYLYKSFILRLLIDVLSLFIILTLTLLLVKIIVHLTCLILKRKLD